MKSKYKITKESYDIDNQGTVIYNIEVELDINSLDMQKGPGCIYKMIHCDPLWVKYIKMINKRSNIQVKTNIITVKSRGKAVCHPDDGYDEEIGKEIAKRKALIKLYKNLGEVLSNLSNIIIKRWMGIKLTQCKYDSKAKRLIHTTDLFLESTNKNYWDDKDR